VYVKLNGFLLKIKVVFQVTNAAPLEDIKYTLVYNAPIDKVWKAVATSDGLAAWFMPNDMQPVEGHEFHINAGPFGMSPCKVVNVAPPHQLSFRWGKDWTLTFELKDLGGKTEFTLIHSGWDAEKVTEFGKPHTPIRENMNSGWAGLVKKLQGYVEA
jgi:uncharacterized protein YndB with AHSA1/START domain